VPELGLFPLGLVLLPGERLPLHIFEARYKELIGECLEAEGEFGLVLADDRGLREIGTRARVTDVVSRFDDGRLNVYVEGGERFRVVRLTSGRSFLTAEVEPVEDDGEEADEESRERALELYGQVADLAGAEPDELDPLSRRLGFEIAARVDFGVELKQRLLEQRSEPERLTIVLGLLEGAAEALAREHERGEHASSNGKVKPLY
jgi:Lon protease-like protein